MNPNFVEYLEDLLIRCFCHSLSCSRQAISAGLLLVAPNASRNPPGLLDEPVLLLVDRLYRHILAPLEVLKLEVVFSGFRLVFEQVSVACASVDRLFPGVGCELERVWRARLVQCDPGEWMLDFPCVSGSEIFMPELNVSSTKSPASKFQSERQGVISDVPSHQHSLVYTPFRKLRREVARWLSQWVRARLSAEETEREVRERLSSELLLDSVEFIAPIVVFPKLL